MIGDDPPNVGGVLVGPCGLPGAEGPTGAGLVKMGHYSFSMPGGAGWRIERPAGPAEEAVLTGELEAAGEGLNSDRHAASLQRGIPGILHGNRTYLLQDADGQISATHSISAGLDYPGVGPEHAWLKDSGRASYVGATDTEALRAFHDCCRIEGIIPALESSHALAHAARLAPTLAKDQLILVNLSGRGDKDLQIVAEAGGLEFFCRASCRDAVLAARGRT